MEGHKSLEEYLKCPGLEVDIDPEIEEELRKNIQKDLTFFGGHPKSLEKAELERMFSLQEQKREDRIPRLAPCQFNVCEKTDGWRYILIVTILGECYLVGRNTKTRGSRLPVFYKANIDIAPNFSLLKASREFKTIVQILDGQLVVDTVKIPNREPEIKLRYLIFDAMVHMGNNIMKLDFIDRIQYAELFIKNNQFSMKWRQEQSSDQQNKIQMFVKDFFDLDTEKDKILQFVLKTYIKAMNHGNDGLIFNKKKNALYKIGKNEGYLKWKPAHLNTIDFLMRPNSRYYDMHEDDDLQIIDLYLNNHDQYTGEYRPFFYEFMVVKKEDYHQIEDIINRLIDERGQMVPGLIAECNYVTTPTPFRHVYRQLNSAQRTLDQLRQMIMMPAESEEQTKLLRRVQNLSGELSWNKLKIRQDKSLANNTETAENIYKTIRENIAEGWLIDQATNYIKKRREWQMNLKRNYH